MNGFKGYWMMESHYEMISNIDLNSYKANNTSKDSKNKK